MKPPRPMTATMYAQATCTTGSVRFHTRLEFRCISVAAAPSTPAEQSLQSSQSSHRCGFHSKLTSTYVWSVPPPFRHRRLSSTTTHHCQSNDLCNRKPCSPVFVWWRYYRVHFQGAARAAGAFARLGLLRWRCTACTRSLQTFFETS